MKKIMMIALLMSVNVSISANVIGPNKSGIYHIDAWGDKKCPDKIEEIPASGTKFKVKSETAFL